MHQARGGFRVFKLQNSAPQAQTQYPMTWCRHWVLGYLDPQGLPEFRLKAGRGCINPGSILLGLVVLHPSLPTKPSTLQPKALETQIPRSKHGGSQLGQLGTS